MLRKGLAVAVILLFIGVAVAPSINADVDKPDIDSISLTKESDEDCGCEEETTEWGFPILCTLLIPLVVIGILIAIQTSQTGFIDFINLIVDTLGCSWA